MLRDDRGMPLTVADGKAVEGYERGLYALRTFRGDATAPLDEAIAAAPDFAHAYTAKALVLMTFFERRFARDALATLDAGEGFLSRASAHEQAIAAAARQLAVGDWHGGCVSLDRALADEPRDILALQVAHLMDFFRGDNWNLRNRVSRVLPQWSPSMPGYSFLLGMHSFGLEECNQYPEAESTGMRALAMAPEDAWAVHAVTHVLEMQGRIAEGIDFLVSRESDWATPDNGFAFHNWWHLALFHVDRGDHDAALAVYDRVLAEAHGVAVSRLDATSMLWRLMLEGVDVATRMAKVADAWQGDLDSEGGYYAFNDFHAALAFAATGRREAIAALREKIAEAGRAGGANAGMVHAVGDAVAEAAIAFCEGRHGEAVRLLMAARDEAWRFGGSHAQRDVLTLTLIEAARRSGQSSLARHYLNERLTHKPASAWGRRIAARIEPRKAAIAA